ncbi:hypothetical protein N7516_007178 [Penicillium verrucosum]|uniref:uncharacterized protein n=1 Tax=Penicillium verrucosum TaxID=60171 RepID=UPI00254572D4|nr:uncharacterized protein N7516_007178 [Penicillium verrucosum]KAJ5932689.1 hypothetical protein N7516_007178 [Penicillium verrucosum]
MPSCLGAWYYDVSLCTATTTTVQFNAGLEVLIDFSIPYLVRAFTPSKSTFTLPSYVLTSLIPSPNTPTLLPGHC